jgi:hypothetical protein
LANDEINMATDALLTAVDEVLVRVRGCSAPFGSVHVVLLGDFLQLPPVSATLRMAFHASVWWHAAKLHTVYLTRVHRQADTAFTQLLGNLRVDGLPLSARRSVMKQLARYGRPIAACEERCRNRRLPSNIVHITGHNKTAELHNGKQLALAQAQPGALTYTWSASDVNGDASKLDHKLPGEIVTCTGALMMVTVNTFHKQGVFQGQLGYIDSVTLVDCDNPAVAARQPVPSDQPVQVQFFKYTRAECNPRHWHACAARHHGGVADG